MTKLSVIVLIYNMEELLPRCLESLENQTMEGIQFILVDDGSTDKSGEICDAWKPERHTVKVIHKENGGVVAGWMDGVNAADGEYVGFVDSDDYVDADMYENLWKAVGDFQVDISMCNHLYEVNGVKTPCEQLIEEGIYMGSQMDELRNLVMPKLAEPYLSPSLCNKIFRKNLFKQNFQFCDKRVTIADDVSVVLPIMFAADSFSYINKPYYHYVTRGNSVTHSYKKNMYFQHEELLNNLQRAIEFYKPNLKPGAFEMTVSAMGNQWLRMITRAPVKRTLRKELLNNFYKDNRYVSGAQSIQKQELNKWASAYCNVVLKHKYGQYCARVFALAVRNKIFRK